MVIAHRFLVARPSPRHITPRYPTPKPSNEVADPAAICEELARSLRAGRSPISAIDECDNLALPPGNTLSHRVEIALSTERDADRRLLLAVLATLAQSGGAGAETLDRCAMRLRTRAEDRREQRVASAPARLSALVLTVLPLGVLALLLTTSSAVRHHVVSQFGAVTLSIGLGCNAAGWRWMRRVINRPIGGREVAALGDLAEVLEATTLLVRAGISPRVAVVSSARHHGGTLTEHLTEFGWRLEHGWLTADALAGLGDRIGPRSRRLIDGLVRAERYGTPLAPVLDRMVDDIDDLRRELAARRTKTLPIRLSAPLVVCTLPSFVLLAVIPAIGTALAGLGSGPLSNI